MKSRSKFSFLKKFYSSKFDLVPKILSWADLSINIGFNKSTHRIVYVEIVIWFNQSISVGLSADSRKMNKWDYTVLDEIHEDVDEILIGLLYIRGVFQKHN